ncbi:class I SAM-dependent methyltransferase [Planotetraspora sp. GP83]|uniref:class I SAM-dependent methyltransferase n=1 Tax=Planotetraspora sp. GP83 TaxID=3156264 RepID=UPI003514594F
MPSQVRDAYDALASIYTDFVRGKLEEDPLDRALLGLFAELVQGPVVELGCGPGRMAAHLHSLGVDAFGIDLSPRLIEIARQAHPQMRFKVGDMAALDLADASVSGVLSWYSIIHTLPQQLPGILAEMHRILTPGGHLLLGFFEGPELEPFDHKVVLAYRWPIDLLAELSRQAGFTELARLIRQPNPGQRFPGGTLLLRKTT